MKKLLSVFAVAAIVTSAFAFTTKGITVFCVRNVAGTACVTLTDVHVESGLNNSLIYPTCPGQWDGTLAGCTGATTTNCSVAIRLVSN